eukprot:scaffold1302_cov245-Pinguiococcus_pyrenoidosus.AAC.7
MKQMVMTTPTISCDTLPRSKNTGSTVSASRRQDSNISNHHISGSYASSRNRRSLTCLAIAASRCSKKADGSPDASASSQNCRLSWAPPPSVSEFTTRFVVREAQ